MDTILNKLLVKLENESTAEEKQFVYIESKWHEEGLSLILHKSNTYKTYKAEVTADQFGRSANELDIPFADFYLECKEALTANIQLTPFEYELNEDELMFKLNKNDDFAVEYLEVPLKELNSNCCMLDTAIELINDLRKAKKEEQKVANQDDSTSKELLSELNRCKDEKEKMEKKLLKRFLILLNSKKDKINELKEQLDKNNASIDDQDDVEIDDQAGDDDFDALTQVEDA